MANPSGTLRATGQERRVVGGGPHVLAIVDRLGLVQAEHDVLEYAEPASIMERGVTQPKERTMAKSKNSKKSKKADKKSKKADKKSAKKSKKGGKKSKKK